MEYIISEEDLDECKPEIKSLFNSGVVTSADGFINMMILIIKNKIKSKQPVELVAKGEVKRENNLAGTIFFTCGGRRIDFVIGNEITANKLDNIKIYIQKVKEE